MVDLTPKSCNMFIVCAVCRRAPSSETRSSETPMKGLFLTLCYRSFFVFFFLLITRACGVRGNIKTVFPVVLCKGVCQTCSPQACVCTSHQKEHTVMCHIHTFSRSPFQNHLCFHHFLSVDQTETLF